MRKLKNRVGERFGRLTVLDLYRENNVTRAECICDCGNPAVIRTADLTNGHTKSCGCLSIEYFRKIKQPTAQTNSQRRGLGRARSLLASIRSRAKNCDLTLEWFEERLNKGVCEVTKLPFDLVGVRTPFSPSIDRKDPLLDYTLNNTQMVIWMYNASKGTWQHEDVLRMARALIESNNSGI